jgi:hypothetical protein
MFPVLYKSIQVTRFCCKTSNFYVDICSSIALLSVLFYCLVALGSQRFFFLVCGEVLYSRVADLYVFCFL